MKINDREFQGSWFDVREFGAAGDGKTKDTEAVQAAIEACGEAGGGYVVLTGGRYCCGTLYFRSGVYIYLMASGTLLASPDIGDYGTDTHYNRYVNEKELDRCFLYGEDAYGIGILGEGEIDGNAQAFPNEGSSERPMMMRFLRCRNIRICGVKLYQAAAWTTAFLDSVNIWVERVDICNDRQYNGDGLDFDGCRNVFVTGCKIKGTDDNLCLQAGSREYPMEHVHISDCHFTSVCAGVRIGLKSIGDIRDVTVVGCTFRDVWREGVKIECTEGGAITDIVISANVMHNVRRPVFILLNNRLAEIGSSVGLESMPEIGRMERISIDGLVAVDDEEMNRVHYRFQDDVMGSPRFQGIRVDAHEGHKIRQLSLRNITYTAIGGVKQKDIPEVYPCVYDHIRENADGLGSENYYPDWSRTASLDVRNVEYLLLDGIVCGYLHPDERPPYLLEGCSLLKKEIYVIEPSELLHWMEEK